MHQPHEEQPNWRRPGRWEVGVLGVVASACLSGAASSVPAASAGTPIHLVSVTMKATMVGWGIDRHLGGQLVHTVNGGRIWMNVTPPGVPLGIPTYRDQQANALPEPPDDTAILTPTRSTAITLTEVARAIDGSGVLLCSHTSDAGRQWREWTVHLPHLSDTAIDDPSLYGADFVNANDGWLQFEPGASSSASMTILGMELWHTTNGGHNWHRVSQISPQRMVGVSPVTFTSATAGWITESKIYHNPILLHTINAGRTWIPVSVGGMGPDGWPSFRGADGALLVYGSRTIQVRTTTNFGKTWGPLRRLPGQPDSTVTVAVLGPHLLLDHSGAFWWISRNGGQTWTRTEWTDRALRHSAMDLLNKRVAWVWNNRTGPSTMAKTTNSGRTWTSWTPMLVQR